MIKFLLSFDDGPGIYTQDVLEILQDNKVQPNTKALFFLLTHRKTRAGGRSPEGEAHIVEMSRQGHVLGIHGGGEGDHRTHLIRALRKSYEDGPYTSALECDLMLAKQRLEDLTGVSPRFVRPPYWLGLGVKPIEDIWEKCGLKGVGKDVHSKDAGFNFNGPAWLDFYHDLICLGQSKPEEVRENIFSGVQDAIIKGKRDLIFSFHDSNSRTVTNLEGYMDTAIKAVLSMGYLREQVEFTSCAEQIDLILKAY